MLGQQEEETKIAASDIVTGKLATMKARHQRRMKTNAGVRCLQHLRLTRSGASLQSHLRGRRQIL
jgi:hypothetical protein